MQNQERVPISGNLCTLDIRACTVPVSVVIKNGGEEFCGQGTGEPVNGPCGPGTGEPHNRPIG